MDPLELTEHDPGHLLPEEDWLAVVAAAEVEAERIAAGHPADEAPRGYGTGALALSGTVTARAYGKTRGAPRFGVLHSAETPLRPGYAASIARYFRDKAATSCHYMTDPAETWGVLPDNLVAYHCGTGNTHSVGVEQAGRAAMTTEEWMSPEGLAQQKRNAEVMQSCQRAYGIGLYWMTDQQLKDAHAGRIVGGWATHNQCRRVLGGTTHTDPGDGFPYAHQMALAIDKTPAPTPAPVPQLLEDDVPSFVISPGQSLMIPHTAVGKSADLWVAADNPDGRVAALEGGDVVIAGVDLRIAVERTRGEWHPVDRPGFPVNPTDVFQTAVTLGAWGAELGPVLGVSVLNRGLLPVTVALVEHR